MRFLYILAVIFISQSALAASPSNAQLDKFFELSGMDKCYNLTISSVYLPLVKMMQTDIVKMKEKDRAKADKVSEKVMTSFTWDNVKPKVYEFYKKNYTAQEMSDYIKALSRPDYVAMRKKQDALNDGYSKLMQNISIQTILQIVLETQLEEQLNKIK